jgi:hypothetical protein
VLECSAAGFAEEKKQVATTKQRQRISIRCGCPFSITLDVQGGNRDLKAAEYSELPVKVLTLYLNYSMKKNSINLINLNHDRLVSAILSTIWNAFAVILL